MSETNSDVEFAGIPVPAHAVPVPATVSPQAQAFLSQRMEEGPLPDVKDKNAWRELIAQGNGFLTQVLAAAAESYPAEVIEHKLGEIVVYEVIPETLDPGFADSAILYCHGGAYIHGAGMAGVYMGQPLAGQAQMRMFCVDYRMPPDHPFPVGLDDAVATYRWLLERYQPQQLAVGGGSAGGGLAAALVLKVRDLGLPLPGACLLVSPEADLTESGDTFETNIYNDVVLTRRLTESIALYSDGHDLKDPYLSPLFGDFSKGYSPTLLTSGTRDAFLSNTVRFHRALLRASIEAELHVWEAMPHGGFFGAPEDQEVVAQQVDFIRKKLSNNK